MERAIAKKPTPTLDLKVKKSDASAHFWNKKAASYAKTPIKELDVYHQKLAITREHLTPDSSVLEFGCGTGSTALLHAPHAKEILAIDFSREMIDIACRKAEEEGVTNVAFQCATLFDLPHEPGSFDVILGLNVLHLIEALDETLERCYELLAPGGVLIASTACIAKANFVLRMLLPLAGKLGLVPRVNIFNQETLEASMRRAGFGITRRDFLNAHGMTCFHVATKPA